MKFTSKLAMISAGIAMLNTIGAIQPAAALDFYFSQTNWGIDDGLLEVNFSGTPDENGQITLYTLSAFNANFRGTNPLNNQVRSLSWSIDDLLSFTYGSTLEFLSELELFAAGGPGFFGDYGYDGQGSLTVFDRSFDDAETNSTIGLVLFGSGPGGVNRFIPEISSNEQITIQVIPEPLTIGGTFMATFIGWLFKRKSEIS